MAFVVFVRAVNVGGHQWFQPGRLARELAGRGIVSIGAAGTFAERETVNPAAPREEMVITFCHLAAILVGGWTSSRPV